MKYPLHGNFDVVARDVMFWLIDNTEDKRDFIKRNFKQNVDWGDITTMLGILDYCYKCPDELGMDFTREIIDLAIKSNMLEVRKTAFRYGYLLFKDERYIGSALRDESKAVRKLGESLRKKSQRVIDLFLPRAPP